MSRSRSGASCRWSASSRPRPRPTGRRASATPSCPPPSRPLSERHAVDLIVDEVRRRPGEITLVTLGPLTNLALALDKEPALPRLLRGYTLMGGAFGASGNTTPTTEWNIHCDPHAAKIVFARWAEAMAADPTIPRPLALGLDVTERAKIRPDDVVRLARRAGSTPDDSIALAHGEDPMLATRSVASNPIVRYVADALRFYMEFHAHYDGFYGAFIHDPLAVAAALDRSLVETEPLFVDVETAGELTAGMTVADRRHLTGKPPNLDVAVESGRRDLHGTAHRTRRGAGGGPVRRGTLGGEGFAGAMTRRRGGRRRRIRWASTG